MSAARADPARARSLARRLLLANKRACGSIEPHLPHVRPYLADVYANAVARHMNALPPGGVVVDVGGGRSCRFAGLRRPESGVTIIAVDVSDDELKHNVDVDEAIVADVVQGLPFGDGCVDMIVSRSVLEHLEDSEAFVRDARRALRSGGYFIHLLPSRFAPFALINRALPNAVARKLVHTFVPGSKGRLGFRTFYDHCSAAEMGSLLSRHGFEIVELRTNYYQADYFDFFVPFYLFMATYELAAWRLRLEQLAATVLIVARKK